MNEDFEVWDEEYEDWAAAAWINGEWWELKKVQRNRVKR